MSVFHLGNGARDATAYRTIGIVNGAGDSLGAIAGGTYFNGIDDSIGFPVLAHDTIVVSAWAYAQSGGSSNYPSIVQTPSFGLHFGFMGGADDRNVTFWTNQSGGNWKSPLLSITQSVWYHIVVVYDASSVDNDPVIYVNGTSVPVTQKTAPISSGTNSAGRGYVGNNILGEPWHGMLDEVRIATNRLHRRPASDR